MNDLELPTEIIYEGINDDVDLSNWEELIDYIVERLSETYGFLVESLSTEIIDQDKASSKFQDRMGYGSRIRRRQYVR